MVMEEKFREKPAEKTGKNYIGWFIPCQNDPSPTVDFPVRTKNFSRVILSGIMKGTSSSSLKIGSTFDKNRWKVKKINLKYEKNCLELLKIG